MADFLLDLAKQIAVTSISFGLLGLFLFAFREYIKRKIDYTFRIQEERLKQSGSADLEMLKTTVPVFREIIELVYKIRNSSRDIIKDGTPLGKNRDLFSECCALLTQRIYMYRLFLDKKTFELLHNFKRHSQDFLLLVDVADRQSNLVKHKMAFDEETIKNLQTIYEHIDGIHEAVTAEIQAKINIHQI